MRLCSVDGCGRPYWCRGWCNTHYSRWRKHGTIADPVRVADLNRICEVAGCGRRLQSRGRCQLHYQAMRDEENRAAGNLCAFDGCERPVHNSNDLCRSHRRQIVQFGLAAPRAFQPRYEPVDGPDGRRLCRMCNRWKDQATFSKRRTACNRCTRLATTYGMTASEFDALLAIQGGVCAICGTSEPGGNTGMWVVDHDHRCCGSKKACEQCRGGLLCNNCNMGLGFFGDDPERLHQAAKYLSRVRAINAGG